MDTFRLLPFQIKTNYDITNKFRLFHVKDGVETEITDDMNGLYSSKMIGKAASVPSIVRNAEMNNLLTIEEETIITVVSVNSGAGTITFSDLPPGFAEIMDNHETNQEWIVVDIDSYNISNPPYPGTGGYTRTNLVTGRTTGTTFTIAGSLSGYTAGNQVVFLNPFSYVNYGSTNLYDLDDADFPTLAPTYVAPGGLFKKSDGTWFSLIDIFIKTPSVTHNLASATAPDVFGPWTANDSILIAASDVHSDYTSIVPHGQAFYIEDEDMYIIEISCFDSAASKWHISLMKFDEDFITIEYIDRVKEEPTSSSGCIGGAICKFNDEWHLFYTDRTSGNLNTDPWLFKHCKSDAYDGTFSEGVTLLSGSTSAAGASTALRNQWYNMHIDQNCAFEYEGRLFTLIGGTSRHKESGNVGNRYWGVAEYDTVNDELIISNKGVEIINFLGGLHPNSTWAFDHTGGYPSMYNDNGTFYTSYSMNAGSDTYKCKFIEVDMAGIIGGDSYALYDGSVLGTSLPRGLCYFKALVNDIDEYYSEDCLLGNANGFLKNWTVTSGTATVSGRDITSLSGLTNATVKSNAFDILKDQTINVIFELLTGTPGAVMTAILYDSAGVQQDINIAAATGDNYIFALEVPKTMRDAYIVVTLGGTGTVTGQLWDIYTDYSNEFVKYSLSSAVDFGGVKYSTGWEQWIFKGTNVRRSPRSEIIQIGEEVNGVFIPEKKITGVRYKMNPKITEQEYEAFVHSLAGEVTVTDQTGRQFTATKTEIADPSWSYSNGVVEISFVDENNINVYTLNNSEL